MIRYIKNEKGSALVMILIIMLVLSILGVALISTSLAESKLVTRQEKRMQAHYLARSGADAAATHLLNYDKANVKTFIDSIKGIESSPNNQLDKGTFTVIVNGDDNLNHITIQSIGTVNEINQKMTLKLNSISVFESAIFAYDTVEMNNATVTGGVTSGVENIISGNSHIYDESGNPINAVVNPEYVAIMNELLEGGGFVPYPDSDEFTNPNPAINVSSQGGDVILNSSSYYNNFNEIEAKKNSLIFDTSSGPIKIMVNELTSKPGSGVGDGNIIVSGDHDVFIYVNNTLDYKGQISRLGKGKVFLFGKDESTIINLQSSGPNIFDGYIIAPESQVVLKSGDFTGGIIGNKVSILSGGDVTYKPSESPVFPDEIDLPFLGYKIGNWDNN